MTTFRIITGMTLFLQVEACMKAALTSTRITYLLPSHSLYVEESGIILMILNDIGIIKIVTKDAPSFLFINIVLGLLFIGFIAIGVWSLKYSNKIKAKAETEDKKAANVLNWLEDNITKEDIENSYTGDIQEEMKYFNRTAYVKEQLTVQFTELSDEEAENFSEQFVEKMFN